MSAVFTFIGVVPRTDLGAQCIETDARGVPADGGRAGHPAFEWLCCRGRWRTVSWRGSRGASCERMVPRRRR